MTDAPREFSRLVEADRIPTKGRRETIEPTEEERIALAARFGLVSLSSLVAKVFLKPLAGGPMIRVELALSADVEQECVISGVPVPAKIDVDAELDFAPPKMVEENLELTLSDADPPEAFEDGMIDLGEVVAQQLALALDPYPRAADADFDSVLNDLPAGRKKLIDRSEPENPFAKLATLRQDGRKD